VEDTFLRIGGQVGTDGMEAVSHGTADEDAQESTSLTHQTSDRTQPFLFLSLPTHGWWATKIVDAGFFSTSVAKVALLYLQTDLIRQKDKTVRDRRFCLHVRLELHSSGRWLSGSPIIRIGLVLRVNLSRILQN